jgi:hypothetical protein
LKKRIFKNAAVLLILLLSLIISACGNIVRFDSGFCGKVMDKETNEPISGVVVIADWENISPSPGGAVHTVYKVAEVITNDAGEFCLKGRGLVFLVDQPSIEIFKAGYSNIADSYLPNLRNTSYWKNDILWEDGKAIIRLRKLSIEERHKRFYGISQFDRYIDQGILSAPNYGVKSNDAVKKGRKLFDAEVKKEDNEVRQYHNQLEENKKYQERMNSIPMYGKPPSKAPSHLEKQKTE